MQKPKGSKKVDYEEPTRYIYIFGPPTTGSGKTTFINLICKIHKQRDLSLNKREDSIIKHEIVKLKEKKRLLDIPEYKVKSINNKIAKLEKERLENQMLPFEGKRTIEKQLNKPKYKPRIKVKYNKKHQTVQQQKLKTNKRR